RISYTLFFSTIPRPPTSTLFPYTTLFRSAADSVAFQNAVKSVKGKFVLISMNQPTGRPDYNWEEFATPESFEKMKKERAELAEAWNTRLRNTGYNARTLPAALEKA